MRMYPSKKQIDQHNSDGYINQCVSLNGLKNKSPDFISRHVSGYLFRYEHSSALQITKKRQIDSKLGKRKLREM